jgi:RNA polymerase sigma factor for flagellar operon FliA
MAPAAAAVGAVARRPGNRLVETLVREHIPLVGNLVRAVTGRVPAHVNRDDLVSAGMLALVLAARSFDQSRGVPFVAFAARRIRGALTDVLRSMDWASRGVRSKARQIDTVRHNLAATLGRTPTRLETAQAMGVPVSELDKVDADVDRASVVSLSALTPESTEESLPTSEDSPEELIIKRERIGYLRDAIAELPDRLRTVVQLSFFQQCRMSDIARQLGVTESRVSQLRAEALRLLRAAMSMVNLEHNRGSAAKRSKNEAGYVAAVAARSTLGHRLKATSPLGDPRLTIAIASGLLGRLGLSWSLGWVGVVISR